MTDPTKIVEHVLELREELSAFLYMHNLYMHNLVLGLLAADKICFGKFAYLADIFKLLSQHFREKMRTFYFVKTKWQHSQRNLEYGKPE